MNENETPAAAGRSELDCSAVSDELRKRSIRQSDEQDVDDMIRIAKSEGKYLEVVASYGLRLAETQNVNRAVQLALKDSKLRLGCGVWRF
jgi:hypothetical protein